MSMVYELGPTSATAITLYPGDNFEIGKVLISEQNRTSIGLLYQHKHGTFNRIKIQVDFMISSHASFVNSWWDSLTKLRLFITSESNTAVYSCMIMGDSWPMVSMSKPYDDRYKGTILLEGY